MDEDKVRDAVHEACRRLLGEPAAVDLLKRAAHELVLTHRFAYHLESIIDASLDRRSVDIDYNRHGLDKKLDHTGRLFRPDVIVHRRGSDDENLLVVEWKKRSPNPGVASRQQQAMLTRLRLLRDEPLGYKSAVFIDSHAHGLTLTWLDNCNQAEAPVDISLND